MKRLNVKIILILLLILFVILMLYYHFYVRKIELQNREKFELQYTDEIYDDGGVTFSECNTAINPLCTNTYAELEKNTAEFTNTHSNYYADYKLSNIRNTSHPYRNYGDIMTNQDLLSYRCLNKSPKVLQQLLNTRTPKIASTFKKMFLYNEASLVAYITTQISTAKAMINSANNKNSNKILGPVYACVSQAPFLQYKGEMIKARFDVTNNQRSYYKEEIIGGQRRYELETGIGDDNRLSSLYTEVLIIYSMYDATETDDKGNTTRMSFDESRLGTFESIMSESNFYVHDKLCFLKCNKSPLNCGCLNASTDDINPSNPDIYKNSDLQQGSLQSYESKCYNHRNEQKDYSIMYYVNPYGHAVRDDLVNINR